MTDKTKPELPAITRLARMSAEGAWDRAQEASAPERTRLLEERLTEMTNIVAALIQRLGGSVTIERSEVLTRHGEVRWRVTRTPFLEERIEVWAVEEAR